MENIFYYLCFKHLFCDIATFLIMIVLGCTFGNYEINKYIYIYKYLISFALNWRLVLLLIDVYADFGVLRGLRWSHLMVYMCIIWFLKILKNLPSQCNKSTERQLAEPWVSWIFWPLLKSLNPNSLAYLQDGACIAEVGVVLVFGCKKLRTTVPTLTWQNYPSVVGLGLPLAEVILEELWKHLWDRFGLKVRVLDYAELYGCKQCLGKQRNGT